MTSALGYFGLSSIGAVGLSVLALVVLSVCSLVDSSVCSLYLMDGETVFVTGLVRVTVVLVLLCSRQLLPSAEGEAFNKHVLLWTATLFYVVASARAWHGGRLREA